MQYEHLQLVKLPEKLERRKQPAPVPPPVRNFAAHSKKIGTELNTAIALQKQRRTADYIDPSLILRVRMSGLLQEDEWEKLGLRVVASEPHQTLVLFTSADEMTEFRRRLNAYAEGPPEGQKGPQFNGFIGGIESIAAVAPKDRIGERMRLRGLETVEQIDFKETYVFDIELWEMGNRAVREHYLQKIAELVEREGGEVFDRYVGPSITMLRAETTGRVLALLLSVEDVASVDFPPTPDLVTQNAMALSLENAPELEPVSEGAQLIGIIDSGINDHPFLKDIVVGSIGVPATLGTADDWGHGTRVAGVAAFGDLRAQIGFNTLQRGSRICTAKVVNSKGAFDDKKLVTSQMREALESLHGNFGCRIFVIALADIDKPYSGGKLGPWSATLDEIARELDVLIVVSAGNRMPRSGARVEEGVTHYPKYLLEDGNRLYEPGGAVNVLTVGAIAHGDGLDVDGAENMYLRPTAKENQPSAFTRVGPGMSGAIKPDLVDIGGTLVFDGVAAKLRNGDSLSSAGVLTTHHLFLDRLIASGSGTSYSAPRVAFSAAQILEKFPDASANLLRALLVNSAQVPESSDNLLSQLGKKAIKNICGYGKPDLERAAYSNDSRIVLYVEDTLSLDYFAVYRIPVPDIFQKTPGERQIKVTLAFSPPVRSGRLDYMGYGMSYRLIRGCGSEKIFEHYRKREKKEGPIPDMEKRFNCDMFPKSTLREKSSLQSSAITFKRNVEEYGGNYFLVVRAESGWEKTQEPQKYAVVVEISHRAEIPLYERVRESIRVKVRA